MITRDAFLFMAPSKGAKGEQRDLFAQCGPCRMFVPQTALPPNAQVKPNCDLCIIHGSQQDVDPKIGSCGLFVPWPTPDAKPVEHVVKDHANELAKGIKGSVTTKESGYVERNVRCENCEYEEDNVKKCGLYAKLNKALKELFKLDEKIEEYSCCNAQEPKSKTIFDDLIPKKHPIPGAQLAPDGHHYVKLNGQYHRVEAA